MCVHRYMYTIKSGILSLTNYHAVSNIEYQFCLAT